MLKFLLFFLISYTVCFILFTILFYFMHLIRGRRFAFRAATNDIVDLMMTMPLSWLFSLCYILYLFLSFPIWFFQSKKRPPKKLTKNHRGYFNKYPKKK
ncbi:hypothetical protein [Metabacillus arenae]|uniref:hypothetical protein n=1 Tax=Metabacillus arenae TaxID=2771434 RepID=UPI0017467CB0|nr:hypothetical protein [Metabacillus arenae]